MKSTNPEKKPARPKRTLRLPDLDHAKTAVLNTLNSPDSQRSYRFAIDDFIAWHSANASCKLWAQQAGIGRLVGKRNYFAHFHCPLPGGVSVSLHSASH
jgi:hypothetical protein